MRLCERTGLISTALLALVGCTTPVLQSDVTRFSAPNQLAEVRSFNIRPTPDQVGSLEFQQYANLVANELVQRGWTPMPAGSGQADTNVTLSYGVEPSVTEYYRSPRPYGYGGFGIGSGFGRRGYNSFGLGMGVPMFGDSYDVSSYTRYPKHLSMVITDARAGGNAFQPHLFEGRAVSASSRRELPAEMPYLVQALFQNFPGTSGQTVRVTVPME